MAHPVYQFLLTILLYTLTVVTVEATNSTCLDSSGVPFPLYKFMKNSTQCDRGFYCPNLVPNDSSTWPTICPPTSACQITRLQSQFCSAQGLYDPIVCPAGYYCPDDHTKLICPDGFFCEVGQSEPTPCKPLSYCPEGSSKRVYYGSLIWILVVDFALAFFIFLYRRRERKINENRTKKYQNLEGLSVTMNIDKLNHGVLATLPKYTQTLCRGFDRAREDYMLSEWEKGHLNSMDEQERLNHRYLLFQFYNLSLSIPKKGSNNKMENKTILAGVTGSIKPGSVTAILGPSGAGKTTFLNTLMGKVDSSWARGGSLQINGRNEQLTKYKKIVGFVPQEDVMHRELTVYQNIRYSADLRLPRSWTEKQREMHTQAVISALQLTNIHDSNIGDETERGISGGQRKRVNIGMELASAPSALFLDEPTSGLDSTAALDVCRVLKDIASYTNMTVAMVIHQPRVEIWNSLDQLLILGKGGQTVYEGPQRLCQSYFVNHLALSLNPQDNPADVIMDAIASEGDAYVRAWQKNGPDTLLKLSQAFHNEKNQVIKNKLSQKPDLYDNEMKVDDNSNTNNNNNAPTPVLKNVNNSSIVLQTNGSNQSTPPSNDTIKFHDLHENEMVNIKQNNLVGQQHVEVNHNVNVNNINNNENHNINIDSAGVDHSDDDDDDDEDNNANKNIDNNNGHEITMVDNNNDVQNNKTLSPLKSDGKNHARGANFFKQILLFHNRSIQQQLAKTSSLVLEIVVGLAAGLIMGLSADGNYQGILIAPYTLLSPAPLEWWVPQFSMFVCMSISLAAASAGVRVFNEEQVVFWRESSSGSSPLAYFIGVNLANIYRQFLDALHFTFIFHILSKNPITFELLLLLVFLQFFGTYGLGALVSQVTRRENGALVAVVCALIMSVFNGYAKLPLILQVLTPGRWMTEALFTIFTEPFGHLMQITQISQGIWGYTIHQLPLDFGLLILVGIGYRAIAYFFMVGTHRDKQR